MLRRAPRAVAGLAIIGLLTGLLAAPAGASTTRAQQGVTKDEILIALLVPDIDSVRAKGVSVSNLTTEGFARRFKTFAEAFGPINGRKLVVKNVPWDPLDATSFDKACIAATQDIKPFVVVNGSGYQSTGFPCITVDHKTPFVSGDIATSAMFKAAGKNLVTLGLPPAAAARGAANLVAKSQLVPKTAKIGIISANLPEIKEAGDTLKSALKKNGYNVTSKVELNAQSADVSVQNREAAAAVATFQAQGVDTVFNTNSWPLVNGFLNEAAKSNAKFALYGIDGRAALTCTPTSAQRAPTGVYQATCITPWDTRAVATKDRIKPDNALEAKCRKEFEAATGKRTLPGSDNDPLEVDGVTYPQDISVNECNIANFLVPAIQKAGRNLTWDKVYAELMATTDAPAAYLSDGHGGFGTKKPYFAKPVMHVTTVSVADGDTPKDANGLYNGCAVPANCFVPKLVDGQEWFNVG